ncbi:hypothetical protein ACFRAU_07455 [Arthrobacter sp. NPDC056691]|uniref:hypothetical protein n=1 Tax=Arthrobacter sp. NPDC056691 TaxID=3345913 RepID=UPI00366FAA87
MRPFARASWAMASYIASELPIPEATQTRMETCLLEIPGPRLRTHLLAFLPPP